MLSVSWGLAWASFTHLPGQHCGEHQQTCLLLDMHVRFGLVEWSCDSCSIAAEHRNVNTQCHIVPKGTALYSLQDCVLTSRSQTTLGICKPLVLKNGPWETKLCSLYIHQCGEWESFTVYGGIVFQIAHLESISMVSAPLISWKFKWFLYFMHGQSRLSATVSLDSFSSDRNYSTNCSQPIQSNLWTTISHSCLCGVGNGLPWGLQWRKCNPCLYFPPHSDRVYDFIMFSKPIVPSQ